MTSVNPKRVRPIQVGEFLRKYTSRRLLALSEGEIAAFTTSMRQLGIGTLGGAEARSSSISSSSMNGSQPHSGGHWPESKSTRKTALG